MIDKQILNYKITRKIGSGGMATVYEAMHVTLDTKVAIKILDPILAANDGLRQRFTQEAKIMASLNHEGITKVIDFDNKDSNLAIVMEYHEGNTLDEYIKQNGALDEKKAKQIFTKILYAFQYAHDKNIVHRDVKPSNIFITTDGKVKIMDFGIAKLVEDGAKVLTQTGTQMGTPVYMSPEQINDSKHIDHRTDIYSLGVTLWFMLVGKPPYDTTIDSSFQIFTKIVNEVLPELTVNHEVDKIIKKATEKQVEMRFVSCKEMILALQNKVENNEKTIFEEPSIKISSFNKIEAESNLGIEMISVEGGAFLMGGRAQKTLHSITVGSFNIGKYQITQEQWEAVMGNNPSYFKGENLPVERVSWNDVQNFILKLNKKTGMNYRLPTEAEWEYAAGGGNNGHNYKFSGSKIIDDVAWYFVNSKTRTHTVGQKQANELGIHDMSGNVWEWCNDWYSRRYYKESPSQNPPGPQIGTYRVKRGGSLGSDSGSCAIFNRNYNRAKYSNLDIGFRIVNSFE